jgi:hypothetical protein
LSNDEITRFTQRSTERQSAVRGFDLVQEVEAAAQEQERGVDDLIAQVEQRPEAGLIVLGLAKMHFDAEAAQDERAYLADDDTEGHALADELDGTSDEREMRELARTMGMPQSAVDDAIRTDEMDDEEVGPDEDDFED